MRSNLALDIDSKIMFDSSRRYPLCFPLLMASTNTSSTRMEYLKQSNLKGSPWSRGLDSKETSHGPTRLRSLPCPSYITSWPQLSWNYTYSNIPLVNIHSLCHYRHSCFWAPPSLCYLDSTCICRKVFSNRKTIFCKWQFLVGFLEDPQVSIFRTL